MRKPASREITSAFVELSETEVCFLHIQLFGTNGRLPKIHRIIPDVDFESSRSAANQNLETVRIGIVVQCFPT